MPVNISMEGRDVLLPHLPLYLPPKVLHTIPRATSPKTPFIFLYPPHELLKAVPDVARERSNRLMQLRQRAMPIRGLNRLLGLEKDVAEVFEAFNRVLVLPRRPARVVKRADDVLDQEADGDKVAHGPESRFERHRP